MLVSWNDPLEWECLYRLELSTALKDPEENFMDESRIYYIYVNGASSRPPVVEKVEFIPDETAAVILFDSENPDDSLESDIILDTSAGGGSDTVADPFYIDYYIRLAEGAELPFFGFIENFLISPQNSCVSITYHNFQIFNPGESLGAAATPKPAPKEDQAVVRLIVSLTDSYDSADTITFQVYRELEDNLGNSMQNNWLLELFDEDN